jgi:hypothetical protein
MTFSDEYADVLLPFLEQYKSAKNEKERKAIGRDAADALTESRNLREDEAHDLPKELQTVCLVLILCFLFYSTDFYEFRRSFDIFKVL